MELLGELGLGTVHGPILALGLQTLIILGFGQSLVGILIRGLYYKDENDAQNTFFDT